MSTNNVFSTVTAYFKTPYKGIAFLFFPLIEETHTIGYYGKPYLTYVNKLYCFKSSKNTLHKSKKAKIFKIFLVLKITYSQGLRHISKNYFKKFFKKVLTLKSLMPIMNSVKGDNSKPLDR